MDGEAQKALTLARLSPAGFAIYSSQGKWKLYRWLLLLNSMLLKLARREITRLIVTVPPRHGKSEFISKNTPAWWLGVFPDDRIILASYEASFAASWGGKARDLLEQWGPEVFGVNVSRGSWARDRWDIEGHDGGMQTAGAGGPITGKGGNLIIVDDPYKNDKEANSELVRKNVWEWFKSTLYTRLEPGGAMVVLQTRWHEDDLAGRLIRGENGEEWAVLNLPAMADEELGPDELGRANGEPLCPKRYDAADLQRIKTAVGEYWWNALYQQTPHSKDGNIFKSSWLQQRFHRDELYYFGDDGKKWKVKATRPFWTVDTASTLKKTSDWTAVGMFAATQRHQLLVTGMVHGKWEEPEIVPMLEKLYQAAERKPAYIGIEDLGIFQQAKRSKVIGPKVKKLDPDGDKLTRSLTFAAMCQSSDVYWMEGVDWSGVFDELKKFPRGKHDDRVDVCSYAGLEMVLFGAERGLGVVVESR